MLTIQFRFNLFGLRAFRMCIVSCTRIFYYYNSNSCILRNNYNILVLDGCVQSSTFTTVIGFNNIKIYRESIPTLKKVILKKKYPFSMSDYDDPDVPDKDTTPQWQSTNLPINSLVEYINDGSYNLNPEHQRGVVHNTKWKENLIESIFQTGCIPPTFWHPNDTDETIDYDSVDGKQRCATFVEFLGNTWKWRCKYFNELSPKLLKRILNFEVTIMKATKKLTTGQLTNTFNRFQITKKTTFGEVYNSDLCSLRTHLIQAIKEDTSLVTQILKNDSRKQILKTYATLYVHFGERLSQLNTSDISTLWEDKYRENTSFIEKYFDEFHRNMVHMWEVLTSYSSTDILRRDGKIIPLFCALSFVEPSQQSELKKELNDNYHIYVTDWDDMNGSHTLQQHKRYESIKKRLPQFRFLDNC